MKFLTFLVLSGLFFACVLPEDTDYKAREFDLELINADLSQNALEGTDFAIQSSVTGLTIDSTNGKLSFDTLANFAAAGGEPISISYTDSDGSSQTLKVSLKAKASNREELENLIDLFINDAGIGPTGNYNAIDTSQVEDMSALFYDGQRYNNDVLERFNGDISNWNTSQVIDMGRMFAGATVFNQDIGAWDTSQVTDMSSMFLSADAFNRPLNNWNTSQVTDMSSMFSSAANFNRDIGNWNTSNVTDMSDMFFIARKFNQPLNNWDTSKVTDMSEMFWGATAFNRDIGNWDTSKVTNMNRMFRSASAFNQPLNNWDTSKVTDMSEMFTFARDLSQSLNNWDTSNVTNMNRMFLDAKAFNQDISNWNVQAAKNYTFPNESEFPNEDGLYEIFAGATAFNNANSSGAETEPENYFTVLKNN